MQKLVVLILVCIAHPALAWDGPGMWYRAADDANPGGGGILGTGGGHDHGIKCTDCHVERKSEPNLAFGMTFSPQLAGSAYVPGTRYTITARLTGAQLPGTCGVPNGKNIDGFAASFEDDSGASTGKLAGDDGQSAPSCTLPSPPPPGTTALDGDCKVIFSSSAPNLTQWTFSWTAPASGDVHVFWGAVDGDCDMMSMHDAAVTGSMTLTPVAMALPGDVPWVIQLAAAVYEVARYRAK